MEVLAVSHTVMASSGEGGTLKYEAESPDEYALVKAVADLGYKFASRRGDTLFVDLKDKGSSREYKILGTNEFDSARKRMSVVVQKGSEHLLLVKGADNVMLERAQGNNQQLNADLKEFSCQGLRTLVIGRRKLSAQQVSSWQSKYREASQATHDREKKLADAAEEIESQLEILGATAIEDKLQDKVPETIEKIRAAGIKLWVLTGDKIETARNIGFSTRVLTPEMTTPIVDDEEGVSLDTADRELNPDRAAEKLGMMVSGKALRKITDDEDSKEKFLEVTRRCSVIIACRVSPLQKAEMVRLVRDNVREEGSSQPPVTLAVGDGANDVPMIQEAQVGVGIAGREGRQAVNNSDFAIGQFKYLQRLLLVHGYWNYYRACKFTLFTFWRNMVQVFMIFWYSFTTGFSGTCLFEDWVRLSFNVICSLPILAVGVFDQPVDQNLCLRRPRLYETGREGKELSILKTLYTLAVAIIHSLVLLYVTMAAFPALDLNRAGDYYSFGTTVYTCLIVDMNYRAFIVPSTHNIYTVGAQILSLVMYVIYILVYTSVKPLADMLEPDMYKVASHIMSNWYFWFCILATPAIAMSIDFFTRFCYHNFFPDIRDRVLLDSADGHHDCEKCPLQDLSDSEVDNADTEDGDNIDAEDDLDTSNFAQQTLPCFAVPVASPFCAGVTSLLCAFLLLSIGLVTYAASENTVQHRIVYESKERTSEPKVPWDTKEGEYTILGENDCTSAVGAGGVSLKNCVVDVMLTKAMKPPILLYYSIAPFHQNYNDYIKSKVNKELMGQQVSQAMREKKCVKPTRETADGQQIVPCGMQATSLFNDTFEIVNHTIDKNHISWKTDEDRFNNPQDYPARPGTSWLFQRYPTVVTEAEGVKNEAFVEWVRPSALPRVWKNYGWLHHELPAGQMVKVNINSSFPLTKGGFKAFIMTEFRALGGRHSYFAFAVLIGSAVSTLLGFMAIIIGKCCPQGSNCQRMCQYTTIGGMYSDDERSVAESGDGF